MAHVAIIMVHFNHEEDTQEAIDSLKLCRDVPFEIIVIDNGSTKPASFVDVTLIRSEENRGFAGGNNLGLAYALEKSFTHILLLNNDTTVESNLLSALVAQAGTRDVILGGKLIHACNHDMLDHLGGNWNHDRLSFDLVGLGSPVSNFSKPITMDYVCGCCLFAPVHVFKTLGPMYEPYFLYWEESDYCFRAKTFGITCEYCPEAIVYHKGAITHEKKSAFRSYYIARNKIWFLARNNLLDAKTKSRVKKEFFRKLKHTVLHAVQIPFRSKEKWKRFTIECAELNGLAKLFFVQP